MSRLMFLHAHNWSKFVMCIRKKIKEEFLLCRELETTTKAQDVFVLIDNFFQENGIEWKNLCGICTDGAPAMLGSRSGFQKLVKDRSLQVTGIHCIVHRQALACKTMPPHTLTVMTLVIKIVNFIKSRARLTHALSGNFANILLLAIRHYFSTHKYGGFLRATSLNES